MRRAPARHQPYFPPQAMYYPPESRGTSAAAVIGMICTILLTLAGVTAAGALVWRAAGGVLPSLPGALVVPTQRTIATVAPWQPDTNAASQVDRSIDNFNATQVAQVPAQAAQPAVVPPPAIAAPAGVDALGRPLATAVIMIPTTIPVEQVVVIPHGMPALAPDPMVPTAIPTMVYPTALPAAVASNFEVSPDGTCITAPRNGKRYQVCQGWKYSPAEQVTVADLIRGGTLPGVEVQ
jgi:hypothetical protein